MNAVQIYVLNDKTRDTSVLI